MKKGYFLIIIFFLISSFNFSKDINIKASVSSLKIGLDDYLQYTITFKGINNPNSPDLSFIKDFDIVSTSRSSEFRFTNGVSSYLTNFIFSLKPKRIGKLKIPSFEFTYKNKNYRTQAFEIEVVKGSVSKPVKRRKNPFYDDFFDDSFGYEPRNFKIDLFLKAVVSRKKLYKGEQLTYKVLLYTRNNVRSVNLVSSSSIKGFWQEWYPLKKTISGTRENYNGKIYNVFEIKKAALFPTQVGKLEIPALDFEVVVVDTSFFGLGGSKVIKRSTNKIDLFVKEIPYNRELTGVGKFEVKLDKYKTKCNINDIYTYSFIIKGDGNIKNLNIPVLESNEFFTVFDPQVKRDIQYNENKVIGILKVEYPISFKKSGVISINSPVFEFFNPESNQIEKKRLKTIVVDVIGKKKVSNQVILKDGVKVEKKNEDIRFIKTGKISKNHILIGKSLIYKILILLPFLFNFLLFFKKYIFDKFLINSKFFIKFSLLNKVLSDIDKAKSYEELYPIIEYFFKKGAKIEYSELTDFKIEEFLYYLKFNQSFVKDFLRIKNLAQSSRFSPIKVSEDVFNRDKEKLIEIVKRIHKRL